MFEQVCVCFTNLKVYTLIVFVFAMIPCNHQSLLERSQFCILGQSGTCRKHMACSRHGCSGQNTDYLWVISNYLKHTEASFGQIWQICCAMAWTHSSDWILIPGNFYAQSNDDIAFTLCVHAHGVMNVVSFRYLSTRVTLKRRGEIAKRCRAN